MSTKSGEPLASFFSSTFKLAELVVGVNRAFLNLSMIVLLGLWAKVGGSWVMNMTLCNTLSICWIGSLICRTFLGEIDTVAAPGPVLVLPTDKERENGSVNETRNNKKMSNFNWDSHRVTLKNWSHSRVSGSKKWIKMSELMTEKMQYKFPCWDLLKLTLSNTIINAMSLGLKRQMWV